MLSYRQQIETLENHLSALQHPVRHSPAEIFTLIKRLHETFIALAAQLQQVHEAMKVRFKPCHPFHFSELTLKGHSKSLMAEIV